MNMNHTADNLTPVPVLPVLPPCPCWAQCADLHLLPKAVREALDLEYLRYYIIVKHENTPTPSHLGYHVQLLDPQTQQLSVWIPACYFIINTAVWPN